MPQEWNDNHKRWPNLSTTPWLNIVKNIVDFDLSDNDYALLMQLHNPGKKTPEEAAKILLNQL
jgi:hypothetical protein